MALVTKVSPSVDISTAQFAPQITGLFAGEDLAIADSVYIKSADGMLYKSDATAATEPAETCGLVARACKAGQPVTVFGKGTRFSYGSGLTPGNILYVAATAGRLDTAATIGDTVGCARVLTATDIQVTRDN